MIDNILFLGCGKMGSIIAHNLVEESGFKPSQISVLEKSTQHKVKGFKYSLSKNYKADLVFIAIKPQGCEKTLQEFAQKDLFHKNTIFVSILAGKKLDLLSNLLGQKAKVIRSMPNLPIQDAQGIFPYLANENITKTQIKALHKIFSNFGKAFELKDESSFDMMTALFGSGPAYIFYLQEIFLNIATKAGIDKENAQDLIQTLFLGSSLMSCNSELDFQELHQSVTSKGGTTQEALSVFKDKSQLKKIFEKAIKAAAKKSKELQ